MQTRVGLTLAHSKCEMLKFHARWGFLGQNLSESMPNYYHPVCSLGLLLQMNFVHFLLSKDVHTRIQRILL